MAQALYYNGTIITVNDAQPLAEALLVEGETIKAVGTLAEVEAQAAPEVVRVDLEGKAMTPGFIDGHSHMVFSCLFPRFDAPPTGDIDSVDKLVEAIKAYLEENPVQGDNWLVGMGYDNHAFADGQAPQPATISTGHPARCQS